MDVTTAIKSAVGRISLVRYALQRARLRRARVAAAPFSVAVRDVGTRLYLEREDRRIIIEARHVIYVPDISARFDAYWNCTIPTEDEGMLTVDYAGPRLHRYAKSGLTFWLSSFPEELEALEAYDRHFTARPGDTVFDLGGYCGVSAHHFARAVGTQGRVFVFEPDPLNYQLLLRNIGLHGLDNVTPVCAAIAASSGTRSFNVDGSLGSSIADILPRGVTAETHPVRTLSIEDACNQVGATPSIAKIDIEGAEIEVLAASAGFLARHRCSLVIDTSHCVDGVQTATEVERVLRGAGYHVESADDMGPMTTWAWMDHPAVESFRSA